MLSKPIIQRLCSLHSRPGLRGQIVRFLIVGGIATVIDLLFYLTFMYYGGLTPSWAKRFSFVLGSFWAFFMHKAYTFKSSPFSKKQPFLFILVYSVGWWVNSLGHDLVLKLLGIKSMAYILGTALSMVCNFILQKYFVFKVSKKPKIYDRSGY